MSWKSVTFERDEDGSHFKSHLVTASLADALRKDLEDRGGVVEKFEEVDCVPIFEAAWGPFIKGQPSMEFDLHGNTLSTYCHIAGYLLESLQRYKEARTFEDGSKYYKIHARHYCMVLTPGEKAVLEAQCAERLEEAEDSANAFMEAWKAWAGQNEEVRPSFKEYLEKRRAEAN